MKIMLVSGFLGSGKSTAIQRAALEYMDKNISVGVITNDQGARLVDSRYMKSSGIPAKEVTRGCFCCNFESLDESISDLLEELRPEIIFAESVGSCTDLIATVINPLEHFYPERHTLNSVFADARILPVLIRESSYFFDEKIHYIYKSQLEEADIVIVNKVDLLNRREQREVRALAEKYFGDKIVLYQNSLDKTDIRKWLKCMNEQPEIKNRKTSDIDYTIYGIGEAKLGWYDAEVEIATTDANALEIGYVLINRIYTLISSLRLPVGHLKFFLNDGNFHTKISFTQHYQPIKERVDDKYRTDSISMLINARVQTGPANMKNIIAGAVDEVRSQNRCRITEKSIASFQPGYPRPAYRFSN